MKSTTSEENWPSVAAKQTRIDSGLYAKKGWVVKKTQEHHSQVGTGNEALLYKISPSAASSALDSSGKAGMGCQDSLNQLNRPPVTTADSKLSLELDYVPN